MNKYNHSVSLDIDKCNGCTTCLKHCPTEAIRIREGHAVIDSTRCIDCGACIRMCPNQAKKADCSKLDAIFKYRYRIALPAPTLYGQFDGLEDVDYVLQGLLDIGFHDVYEVAQAAELVSEYTRRYLKREGIQKPVISSACPVVVRLIALRFPTLSDHVMSMLPPMEIAAKLARAKAMQRHPELKPEEIGVCFISPCPAKVSYVNNGYGSYKSSVDVVVSMSEVYFKLLGVMQRDKAPIQCSRSGMIGVSWAASGGESTALFSDRYLAADGIENVIRVLDEIETGNIPKLEFIELNACPGGCVGGTMAVENPFIAQARLQTLRRYLPVSQNFLRQDTTAIPSDYLMQHVTGPQYQPVNQLSTQFSESLRMLSQIEELKRTLPGIDCGACGAPSCRALAEDVVKGQAHICDCVIAGKTKRSEKPDEA